jgi:type IV pilus assembly protein PilA
MNSDFQYRFLQYLQSEKEQRGFTLIELLVVIIIIGILSAIALPSFLNQANKARESEGKQYIGSMNRAQQATYLEKSNFSTDFGTLGLGIASNTTNYVYSMGAPTGVGSSGTYGVTTEAVTGAIIAASGTPAYLEMAVVNAASPINTITLRAYVGFIDVVTEKAGTIGGATTSAVLCQKKTPGAVSSSFVTFDGTRSLSYPACNSSIADTLE